MGHVNPQRYPNVNTHFITLKKIPLKNNHPQSVPVWSILTHSQPLLSLTPQEKETSGSFYHVLKYLVSEASQKQCSIAFAQPPFFLRICSVSNSESDALQVLIPGGKVPNEHYLATATAIQDAANLLWERRFGCSVFF